MSNFMLIYPSFEIDQSFVTRILKYIHFS